MVFAFTLCWIPSWIITILTRFNIISTMPRNVQLLCAFLLNLSNTINPFIYAGINPLFRREFRRIICCNSGEKVENTHQVSTAETTQRSNALSLRAKNVVIHQQPVESGDFECGRMNVNDDVTRRIIEQTSKTGYNDTE